MLSNRACHKHIFVFEDYQTRSSSFEPQNSMILLIDSDGFSGVAILRKFSKVKSSN